MSSAEALRVVIEFNKLPETDEKSEISRQYLSDEISNYDFFCKANEYLEKVSYGDKS